MPKKPTKAQLLTFYKVQQYYHSLDAKKHVEEYLLSYYNIDEYDYKLLDKNLDKFDFYDLAREFENRRGCDVADNDTWESVIDDYIYNNRICIEEKWREE